MAITSSAARPITPEDVAAVRALLKSDPAAARYLSRVATLVEGAAKGKGEHRALVTGNSREMRGVVVYAHVAGSEGAAAINAVSVLEPRRRRGVASALVNSACAELQARGARLVVAEVADDPELAGVRALFARCGFSEGGRVRDFFKRGIDMVVMERRLTT
jgi:ribosomal protein S18 acetylase RimI-like enzyme